jgi:hypothetical protein
LGNASGGGIVTTERIGKRCRDAGRQRRDQITARDQLRDDEKVGHGERDAPTAPDRCERVVDAADSSDVARSSVRAGHLATIRKIEAR